MRYRRWLALLMAALLLTVPGGVLAARATATPDAVPRPTLYPNSVEYDPEHPEKLDPDQLYGWSAILVEAGTGRVIFEKNPDDIRYPASTTKIMTVYLALTLMDNLNFEVTCSDTAVAINYVDDDISSLKLQAGEVINFEELLYATMIYSANDGANVIAETVAGSIPDFVDLMNEKAAELGCTNTHFANPHGLHDDTHYTTPRDMATIARAAMENETFRRMVSPEFKTYSLSATNVHRARTLTSTNVLFRESTSSKKNKYYYEYATGIKTGYTDLAQHCFVGSAEKNGVELISVVMYSGDNSMWRDTILMMDYGFSQYTSVSPIDLYRENPLTIQTSNYALDDPMNGRLPLNISASNGQAALASMVVTFDEAEELAEDLHDTALIQYSLAFAAPIQAGEVIGTLTYFMPDGQAVVYNLTASRSVTARADVPKTLEQIEEETKLSGKVLPRLTAPLLFLALAALAAISLVISALILAVRRARGNVHHAASSMVKDSKSPFEP